MRWIPESELERVKRDTDLVALVRASGVELRPHGRDLVGRCPFHEDHEPSLVVTPSRNLWHCLGACGTGGSAIDWVMRCEGVSFRHAVEILGAGSARPVVGGEPAGPSSVERPLATPSPRPPASPPPPSPHLSLLPPSLPQPSSLPPVPLPSLPSPVDVEASDEALLSQVIEYYHQTLKTAPEALGYLKKRGIDDPEAVRRFKLGYANRTLGLRLPAKARVEGLRIRHRLAGLGILRGTGHEHFNGSLVIPILDAGGRVVGVYGRKVRDDLRSGTAYHLYLPGPHRGVWNLDALRSSKEVILCEALLDALSFWCAGFHNVTSAYGVHGFTREHLEAFKAYGTERVLLAYDRDEAGDRAAEALAGQLAGEGITSFRVRFPHGMDANEYACKVTPAAQALGVLLRSADYLGGPLVVREAGVTVPALPGTAVVLASVAGAGAAPTSGTAVAPEAAPGAVPEAAPGAVPEALPEAAPEAAPELPRSLAAACEAAPETAAEPAAAPSAGPDSVVVVAATPIATPVTASASASALTSVVVGHPAAAAERSPLPSDPVLAAPDPAPPAPDLAPPPVASPVPAAPRPDIPAEVSDTEVVIRFGDRRWRIRGLARATTFEQLRVNVLVARDGQGSGGSHGSPAGPGSQPGRPGQPGAFHIDTLDLYSAKQRAAYIRAAAAELGVKEDLVKQDLGVVLLKVEALQEQQLKAALEPKPKTVDIDEPARQAALDLLRDPKLLDRILADFERCGVVGEETNKLIGYLAAVSRQLDEPLAVIIQSSSAAGKSALMDAVLAFVPPEERVQYSAMTGQSLFYMGEADLQHKILAIAEEEGAERASYALKLLQSEGELSIASTGKDPATGKLVTHEYHVAGPVMILLTTTAIDLDEELLNRCLVLTVNEDREQTRAIHRLQRERQTLEGLLARQDREAVLAVHRNAQRLLRPLLVANPYARHLTFLDDKTRMRRDHVKYLTLIRAIALLHQHQRPVRTVEHHGQAVQYVEVSLEDIATANTLAHEVLGRTLDELPPQTRRFLLLLDGMVNRLGQEQGVDHHDVRFTARQAREHSGWGSTQVKIHLQRLVELEYLVSHRSSRGLGLVYELLYAGQGQDGRPFLMGLLDVGELGRRYDPERSALAADRSGSAGDRSGLEAARSGSGRPSVGPRSGPGRGRQSPEEASSYRASAGPGLGWPENAHQEPAASPRSYRDAGRSDEALPLAAAAAGAGPGARRR